MEKTFREVRETMGVSRRAVQGYEKMGLVSATGHTDRGYLLYDEKAQKRIEIIKMYQEFGFTLKEIEEIIDAPKIVLKNSLVKRLEKLEMERERLNLVIEKVNELIDQL